MTDFLSYFKAMNARHSRQRQGRVTVIVWGCPVLFGYGDEFETRFVG